MGQKVPTSEAQVVANSLRSMTVILAATERLLAPHAKQRQTSMDRMLFSAQPGEGKRG